MHLVRGNTLTKALAVMLAGGLIFGQAVKTVIVPSGSTNTKLSTTGSVTNITTGTVHGTNAYNSFTNFNEAVGSTVNLFLPSGTNTLLNLVNSQAATIDGTLNSILNGKVGGSIFFADPYGVIIGKNGIVNVGAFTAVTPPPDFVAQFFMGGVPSAASTANVLNGSMPLTASGLISVQGKINAVQNVSLLGGSIANSGQIASGATFSQVKPDFSDVVNTAGLQSGNAVVVQNGTIEIRAVANFENSGSILSNGSVNVAGGAINIQAGKDVKLDAGSVLSVAGSGKDSNGGTVQVRAANNAEVNPGSLITAAGGLSGGGGTVDLSAANTVNFNGGQLKAGATNGKPGTVTIDPADLNVTSNMTPNDGTNVTLTGDTITIAPGIVISSRQIGNGTDLLNSPSTGNSGSISMTANSSVETSAINVGDGAEILAHATGGYSAGNVTLQATQSAASSLATGAAQINIGNAVLQGQDVTLASTATASSNSSAFAPVAGLINNTSLGILVNGPASVNTSNATSGITIGNTAHTGTAQITATGKVAITSTATATTTSDLTGISGFAYGESDSAATAEVSKNATITAAGTFALNAASNNTLSVSETTTQQGQSVIAVAFGKASSTSTTQVDGAVTGSNVQIGSTNLNSFSTSASPTDYKTSTGNGGGVGVALGFYQSNATTALTGSATSTQNDVQIAADTTDTKNVVNSSASVPSEGIKSKISALEGWTQNLGNKLTQATVTGLLGSSPAVAPAANSTQLGLAAAVSISETGNHAVTTVDGTVNSQRKVTVASLAVDDPQISAAGAVSGQNADIGGAVAVADFKNDANTYVNGSATITGAGAVSITGEADMVDPALQTAGGLVSDWNFTGVNFNGPVVNSAGTGWGDALFKDTKGVVDSITTGLKGAANPGLFTTSFVNTGLSTSAKSQGGGYGAGGSVNLLGMTNQSAATVTGAATVTAKSADLNVNAIATAISINASGMGLGVGQLASRNPGVSAGTSLGGSYNGLNLSNTSTAYVGDGTSATAVQGNVNVTANTQTLAIDIAQAGDKATQFGITGTFNQSNLSDGAQAYIQSNATVNAAQNVNVNAITGLSDFAVAGALGAGGSAQVGVAVNWNQVDDTTLAYVGDPGNARTGICGTCGVLAGQSVNVTPTSTENLYTITLAAAKSGSSGSGADGESTTTPTGQQAASAPTATGPSEAQNGAGGGGFGFGISGSIAINQVGDAQSNPGIVTKGFINNGAHVQATAGTVDVASNDTSFAVAAGLSATLGQLTSLAGSYSQNTIGKDVEAFTTNATVAGNALTLIAGSNNSLFAVTAGGAVNTEEGISVAGSVNNNAINNTVTATLGDNTTATAIGTGGITVAASEGRSGDQVISVAGGFSASSGGDGVGAAVDMGSYTNNVTAGVGAAQVITTGNAQVTASTNVSYVPIAASLAAGSAFIAGGSLADESITDTTTSSVGGNLSASKNLVIGSADSSTATIVAGGVGIGGDVGIGVSAILPRMIRTTTAQITDGAIIAANGDNTAPLAYDNQSVDGLLVDAKTTGNLSDYAVAGAGSGSTAIAGAVILNQFAQSTPNTLKDDTEATIGQAAYVNQLHELAGPGQSVTLLATDTSGVTDAAGMLAIGGDLGAGVGFDQIVPQWTVNASIGANATVNSGTNVIVASNLQNFVNSYAVSGAGSGFAAAAGAASVINETSTTTASIDGTLDLLGSVEIAAVRNTSKLNALDGNLAVAVGLGAGFGASVATTTTNDTVDAGVGSASNITALGQAPGILAPTGQVDGSGNPILATFEGLSVSAVSASSVNPLAAGGAGSGVIGVQGSVPTTNLTENTTAEIDPGATINPNNAVGRADQSLQVLATDQTNLSSTAGSIAGGAAALAGAVDTDTVNRNVTASITGATVNVQNNVVVASETRGLISSIAASGSAGAVAGAGAVSNITDDTNTTAFVGGGANVAAQNNVDIAANRNTSISVADGSGAIGGVGLNASIANVNQTDITNAYVGVNTSITALALGSGIVAPIVDSNQNLTTAAVSGLSVTAVASETPTIIAVGGSLSADASISGSVIKGSYNESTSALINSGASVNSTTGAAASAQGVNLVASDTTTLTNADGTVGASIGLGVGAAVDSENIQKNTVAGIADGSTVNALGAVAVNAVSGETIKSYSASIAAGIAAASGTTADYQSSPITPVTRAYIGVSNLTVGSLGVSASDNLNLTALSGEVSAGLYAAGAGVDLVIANPTTVAEINNVASLNAAGQVNVGAIYTGTLTGTALAGGGGIISGDAAYSSLADNSTTNATLGGTVPQASNINVNATSTRILTATSGGLSVGGLSAGAAVALTSTGGSTTAFTYGQIGQTPGEQVASLSTNATDTTTTTSTANTLSAGIGSGEYNQANSDIGGTVTAAIGNGTNISLSNELSVGSQSTNTANATVTGGNFGAITIGAADSEASSTPVVSSNLGNNINVSAPSVLVTAQYDALGVSAASHMTAGSLINAGAATSTAIANDSPVISAAVGASGNQASVVNSQNIFVGTISNTNASADYEGNDYSGINVPGNSVATANINNNNQVSTGPNVSLTATSNVTLLADSVNTLPTVKDIASNAGLVSVGGNSDGSTANACINAPGACGFGNPAGGTSVTLGANSLLSNDASPGGVVILRALSSDFASNVLSQGTVYAGIATNNNFANETINDSPTVVVSDATINASSATLDAEVQRLFANSEANSITSAAGSYSTSTSTMNVVANPSAIVSGSAITAPAGITIFAEVADNPSSVQTTNLATASINGFTGSITATATNNSSYHPVASVDGASTLTTSTLNVSTLSPIPADAGGNSTTNPFYSNNANAQNNSVVSWVLTTVQETVDEVVGWIPFLGSVIESVTRDVTKWVETITDSTTNNVLNGNFSSAPSIVMNATLYQSGGAGASLIANPGSNNQAVFSGTGGISAQNDGQGNIVVANILNNNSNTVTLSAPSGSINGAMNIYRDSAYPTINITNNTGENLVINQVQPLNNNSGNPDITLTAADTSSFTSSLHNNSGPTTITVANNSSSNVIFDDYINNPSGVLTINTGGSILGGPKNLLEDNKSSFSAGGNIGASANPINVRMVSDPNPTAPTLSAQAGSDINIAAALIAYESVAPTGLEVITPGYITSLVSGGAVNLTLAAPVALVPQPDRSLAQYSAYSAYNLQTVTAAGALAIANTSGLMTLGDITSTTGNVTVAGQDIAVGSVNALAGTAVIDASNGIGSLNSGTNITAGPIQLSAANGPIGTSGHPINIHATGPVGAQSTSDIYLMQQSGDLQIQSLTTPNGTIAVTTGGGDLHLGVISDAPGTVDLTSSGSILNNSDGTNITAGNLTAIAQTGSIGTVTDPITSNVANGVTALASRDANLTETIGNLNINNITATNGSVTLVDEGGNVNLGTISATSGNTAITATQGAIQGAGNPVNIATMNLALTAQEGGIGSSTIPLNIEATGLLTAQAIEDVDIRQVAGNLAINSITSSIGNVNLSVPAGSASLGNINAAGDASLFALGSILTRQSSANIVAKNVNLGAQNGSIGNAAAPLSINASGQLSAVANKDVVITEVLGDLNANSIVSLFGNVTLVDQVGNVNVGTITDINGNTTIAANQGSILNAGSSVNIGSGNITLTAGNGSIGTTGSAINTEATGQLTAQATGDVNVNQVQGTLAVNSIISTLGNATLTAAAGDADLGVVSAVKGTVSVTAAGSIQNTTGGTNIKANNLNLNAANGSIGTAGPALAIATTGSVTAHAGYNMDLTQVAGDLNVNALTANNGSVMLTNQGGNIKLGTITATSGNTSVTTTQGSILNSGAPINIASGNITIASGGVNLQQGFVGSLAAPLNIIATGKLNVQAVKDINVTQTTGTLSVGTVNSLAGSANLIVKAGDADLGSINAGNANASLVASGSILNTSGGTNITTNNLNLTAQTGSVGTAAAPLGLFVPGQVSASASKDVDLTELFGNLNVSNISSTGGNVALADVLGNVYLGTITAKSGNTAIADPNGAILSTGSPVNIASGNIGLSTNAGPIGSTTHPVTIIATGQLTAKALGDIDITSVSGNLAIASANTTFGNVNLAVQAGDATLGNITTTYRNASVSASGSILDTNHSAGSDLNADSITLTATNGSVGVQADPLNIRSNYGSLFGAGSVNATAKGGIYLNQVNGALAVGQITSQTSDVALAAQGSILNALAFCTKCVNVTGNNTTFTSSTGTIGQSNAAFLVNNRNPSVGTSGTNYLNALAASDIYLTEASGNLLSNTISSTSGNIRLLAASGSGSLNQLSGTQSITAIVNGSSLLIQNIGAPIGTTSAYKAPSPNNVALYVNKAGGSLTVNQLAAYGSITTAADITNLTKVISTNLANPQSLRARQASALLFTMTGSNGGLASVLNANIAPCASCSSATPVIFDKYWTNNGTVNASSDWLEFANAIVGTHAQFQNNYLTLQVTNKQKEDRFDNWQLFVIGDRYQTNSGDSEKISYLVRNPKKHYGWPASPGDVFDYLWSYFGN